MIKPYILLILLSIITFSCNNSKNDNYNKLNKNIQYKLLKLGDSELDKAKVGDIITIDINYKTMSDSLFFSGRRKVQIVNPISDYSIDNCFLYISKGDMASYIMRGDSFFMSNLNTNSPTFIKEGELFKIEIELLNIQSSDDYNNEKNAFVKWTDDFGDYEKELLCQYFTKNELSIKPDENGIYLIQTKKGNGKKVNINDTVTIDYEGKFLDGKFFDSTIKRKESFTFIMGTEWQVIKGVEQSLYKMTEGEKALIIVPSDMAFGVDGSSTGIIPPFTSLIFEIELKKVN